MAEHAWKSQMDAPQFAQLLRQVADALDGQHPMTLTLEGETFEVQPQGKCEVEFERSGHKRELEFEISWREAA